MLNTMGGSGVVDMRYLFFPLLSFGLLLYRARAAAATTTRAKKREESTCTTVLPIVIVVILYNLVTIRLCITVSYFDESFQLLPLCIALMPAPSNDEDRGENKLPTMLIANFIISKSFGHLKLISFTYISVRVIINVIDRDEFT